LAWLLTTAFALLTLPRLWSHELWRDEIWVWQVATESHSLRELFATLARNGHGYLFPLLCYAARHISASPQAMQVLHLAIASAAVFVFVRWAPFERRECVLFVAGYFPFYEYAVISRDYVAGLLLLWIACAAFRSGRMILFGVAIALLCQSTVYAYILALALAWLLVVRRAVAGAAIAIAGGILGLIQLIPAPGTTFAAGWRFGWSAAEAGRVLAIPWRVFVPLPRFTLHFWNSNLLNPWPALMTILGVIALALAMIVLRRSPAALIAFAAGAIGLLAFSYIKYPGVLRHHGHLWLLFVAALWIGGIRFRGFSVLLVIHCFVALFASWMDLRHPFSNGAATAELIRARHLDSYPLFGHREPPAAPVAFALEKPLFAPSRGVFAMHPDYGPGERELSPEEVRRAARAFAQREKRDVILVMDYQLSWEELEPMGAVTGAIHPSEDYWLYRLRTYN